MAQAQSLAELEQIRSDCLQLVRKRAGISAGVAVVPLPGVDMLADVAVFSEMLETINARFGLSQADIARLDPNTRSYVLLAAGRLGSELIGKLVTKQLAMLVIKKMGARWLGKAVLRFVPLAGQAVAAGLSYQIVARLGRKHIDDCYTVASALLAQGPTPQEKP